MPAENPADISVETLKSLTRADASRLAELARMLDPSANTDVAALRRAIRRGDTLVFVIRRHGLVVAAATAVRFLTPVQSHCRLEDVIVDPSCRGLGLGRRLVSGALDLLRNASVASVDLTSRPSRRAANALYRSLGFKRHITNVYRLDLTAARS